MPGTWSGTGNKPKSGKSQVYRGKTVARPNSGKKLIDKIYGAARVSGKGLPPIHKTPPAIVTTGTGVGNAVATLGSLTNSPVGGGIGAGAIPSLDTGLHVNTSDVAKRAKTAAAVEYNPQIDAIKNMIGSTQKAGDRNIQDTTSSYAALQAAIQKQLPGVNANYDNAQAQTAQAYQQLIQATDSQYANTAASDKAEFARLGISDANGVLAKQSSDQNFIDALTRMQAQGAASASDLQQQGAAGLTQNNANNAGLAGANAGRDMRNTLAAQILQMRQQKGSLQGTKGKAIQQLMDQYNQEALANAQQDRAFGLQAAQFGEGVLQDRRNFKQSQETSQANLALGAYKANLSAQQAATKQQAADYKNLDPQERAAAKAEQLVPGSGDRVFAYLQKLFNSDPNVRRGYYIKNQGGKTVQVKITPEQFGYLARQSAGVTGLPKGSVEKIATAYWQETH
jgi:hypothetical protein